MKKLLSLALVFGIFGCLPALGQRQFSGTGKYQNHNQAIYIFVCGPYGSSGTVPLPKPPRNCGVTSADQVASVYTSSALTTTYTQPISVASGAQWSFFLPSTLSGAVAISVCTSPGAAATSSTDAADPAQCETFYQPGSGCAQVDVAGDTQPVACTSLPTVPGSGYNYLTTDGGVTASYRAGRPQAFSARSNATYATTTAGTGSTQTIVSLTIPANAVQPGGVLTVQGGCKFAGTLAATTVAFTVGGTSIFNVAVGSTASSVALTPTTFSTTSGDTTHTDIVPNAALNGTTGIAVSTTTGSASFYAPSGLTLALTWNGATTETIYCTLSGYVINP